MKESEVFVAEILLDTKELYCTEGKDATRVILSQKIFGKYVMPVFGTKEEAEKSYPGARILILTNSEHEV